MVSIDSDETWWLMDLAGEQVPGHHLYPAPTRRRAQAVFRADMINHFREAGLSYRFARDKVRALGPYIVTGPLTPLGAFEHLRGWAWAWAITARREKQSVPAEPAAPAGRQLAVTVLGDREARLIEEDAARETGVRL